MAEAQLPENALKRKRSSPSISSPAPPPPKTPKTTTALQINYLARQSNQDLPLLNKNEAIPSILDVLSAYSSVLDRHESLASNLGARPLGPILIKRFERCFDSPPEIIASHSHAKDTSETPQVTWLEVIQFAQSHPGQFTLSTFSEGRRVCQFYYPQKQVRVQVIEEDFLFIKSGRCQDLIPPLPIWEDEEKEVGTCEILEKQLRELTNAADTVAARTRQLSHRLKGRRMAIMERRAEAKNGQAEGSQQDQQTPDGMAARSSIGGQTFASVNGQSTTGSPAAVNGDSTSHGSVRSDLLRHFQSLSQNQQSPDLARRQSMNHPQLTAQAAPVASPSQPPANFPRVRDPSPPPQHLYAPHRAPERPDPLSYYLADPNPPPPVIAGRPMSSQQPSGPPYPSSAAQASAASKHNFSRPLAPGAEMTQPFRSICQAHMESLPRGSRVMPPCDRCRRLKMDCLKNLTSCQGCTKKHARCHWREVDRAEVEGLEGFGEEDTASRAGNGVAGGSVGSGGGSGDGDDSEDEDMAAVEDLEALEREGDTSMSSVTGDQAVQQSQPQQQQQQQQQHQVNGYSNSSPRLIAAAAVGQSSVNAGDRARDDYRGGLPYPGHGSAARQIQHEPQRTHTPQQTQTVPFPSFQPPISDRRPDERSHPPIAPAQPQVQPQTSFRPMGFTSVNGIPKTESPKPPIDEREHKPTPLPSIIHRAADVATPALEDAGQREREDRQARQMDAVHARLAGMHQSEGTKSRDGSASPFTSILNRDNPPQTTTTSAAPASEVTKTEAQPAEPAARESPKSTEEETTKTHFHPQAADSVIDTSSVGERGLAGHAHEQSQGVSVGGGQGWRGA